MCRAVFESENRRRIQMKRLLTMSLFFATTAYAHHGWSEYDAGRPLQLDGVIVASGYEHPHGFIKLKSDEKTWHVVLAPPTRMQNRGLPKEMLTAGTRAVAHGYPNRDKPEELRAERVTVGDKTTELR
jgi:hypothetical protein